MLGNDLIKVFGTGTRKSFATPNIGTSPMVFRSNVLKSSSGLNSETGIIKIPTRSLQSYLTISRELKAYEMFDFTQNVLTLISDYINAQIDLSVSTFVDIQDDKKLTDELNRMISTSKFNDRFLESINDIIYYGGKAFKITTDVNRSGSPTRIRLQDIVEPYAVVSVTKNTSNDTKSNDLTAVRDAARRLEKGLDKDYREYRVYQNPDVDVPLDELLYMGVMDFRLFEEARGRNHNMPGRNAELEVEEEIIYSGKPLFYSLTSKLKEFIVKETLISILGLRELLMPTFYKLGIDLTRSTDTSGINSTINELESKINQAVDTSMLVGDTLDIGQLVNAMFSTVRVLPDPGNMLSSIDELNLEGLKQKLETIIQERDTLRNTILESIGIPPDLFEGGSNQYEVMTRSQRYESTVSSKLAKLRTSYIDGVVKMYRILHPKATKEELNKIKGAKLNLFRVSSIEINRNSTILTQNQDLADNLSRLIDTFENMMKQSTLVNKENAMAVLRSTLDNLGPAYSNLLVEKMPSLDTTSGGW